MTLASNLLLCKRNILLKKCSSRQGPKDQAILRTGPFDALDVFHSDFIAEGEDIVTKSGDQLLCPPHYFCFFRRPASHLVSRHFRQQFLSYLYQIWHAVLLG